MTVVASVTLPAQPSTGTLTRVPLGGNGFSAPNAAYALDNMNVTGDAGGGSAILTVTMDDRFCALVAYTTAVNVQTASADADLRMRIVATGAPVVVFSELIPAISATVSTATISKTWFPEPVVIPGTQQGTLTHDWLNVLGDVYFLNAMIYLFDIRVREVQPMGPILWARGSS